MLGEEKKNTEAKHRLLMSSSSAMVRTGCNNIVYALLVACCMAFLVVNGHGCHPEDRRSLLAFKSAITNDTSGYLSTWNATTDCCGWAGIDCDASHGRVVELHRNCLFGGNIFFGGGSMTGTLSSSLGGLTSLRILDLTSCTFLYGPIPPSLGRLSNLTDLLLGQNSLTGPVPSTFGNLVRLKSLELWNNQLSGAIPPSVFSSPVLSRMFLSGNNFSGPIPATIGRAVGLDTLMLQRNKISGTIPATIGRLRNLTYLELSNNQITGRIPDTVGDLVSLQSLVLSNNQITGRIPDSVGDLVNIQSLMLSNNRLTGEIPHWIGNLSALSVLNLSNNMLDSQLPKELGNLPVLAIVDLSSNKLSGPIRPVLARSANKAPGRYDNTVVLSNNNFTGGIDEDIGELPAMLAVIRFAVSHNPMLEGKIPESMGNLEFLEEVKMAGNGLSGGIPASVLNLSSLTEFDVSDNRLSGRIPAHRAKLGADGFKGNPNLCGDPLPQCKS